MLVRDLCLIVERVNGQIRCDRFEKTMIENIQKYGMNAGFVTPVLNLIDQASLYGQNTIAYFLNSLLNRVNPDVAQLISNKRNFTASIDAPLFEKMIPFVFKKILDGEVEYNSERYKFREFVGRSFESSVDEVYPITGLGVLLPIPTSTAKLFGISENGEPIFIRDEKKELKNVPVPKSITLKLENKVVEFVNCKDFSSCSSVVYKIADLATGGSTSAALKGVKLVTSDDDVRSLITSSDLNTCRATCGALLLSDLSLGSVAEVTSLKEVEGVATKIVKVRKLAGGLVKGVNVFETLENFLVETQEDVIRAHLCETDCFIQDTFRKVEEKEKYIRARSDTITFLDSKIEKLSSFQISLNSIRSLSGKYKNDSRMAPIIADIESGINSNLLAVYRKYIATFNESSSRISSAKDIKTLETEKINIALAEKSLVDAIISFGNSSREKVKNRAIEIAQEDRMNRGDPTGAGGHGRMPERPTNPSESSGGNTTAGTSNGASSNSTDNSSATSGNTSTSSGSVSTFPVFW